MNTLVSVTVFNILPYALDRGSNSGIEIFSGNNVCPDISSGGN